MTNFLRLLAFLFLLPPLTARANDFQTFNSFLQNTFGFHSVASEQTHFVFKTCAIVYAPPQVGETIPRLAIYNYTEDANHGLRRNDHAIGELTASAKKQNSFQFELNLDGSVKSAKWEWTSESCEEEGCVDETHSLSLKSKRLIIDGTECQPQTPDWP